MQDFNENAAAGMSLVDIGALNERAVVNGVGMETVYNVVARNAAGDLLWEETAKNRVVTAGLNKLLDATFKTGLAAPAWYIGICGPSVSDASITNSSTTLNSASAGFTAADVGRSIIVRGGGGSGADLVTTIASYVSATQITLGAAAGATLTAVPIIWEARAGDVMSSHVPWSESAAYSAPATRPAFTPGTTAAGSVDNSGSPASYTINTNNTLIGGLFLTDNNTISGTTGTLYGMAPFTISFRQLNSGDTLTVTATLTAAST